MELIELNLPIDNNKSRILFLGHSLTTVNFDADDPHINFIISLSESLSYNASYVTHNHPINCHHN